MTSSLAVSATAAGLALALVLVLTFFEPLLADQGDLRAVAVLAWAASPLVFVANALITHRPSVLLLRVLAAVYLTVCVATLGRPALVMDQLLLDDKELRRRVTPGLRRRIALSQGLLLCGIVVIAVVWAYSEP